jgi:catechol 2,3-dioxygenase-like lactoylglutathione lyase family enzyme
MAILDHLILKVNDLEASIAFYTGALGFSSEGTDGPFTVVRAGAGLQLLLVPCGTPGYEHYAFAVSKAEFDAILERIKSAGVPYGPTYDTVGSNAGLGEEPGARGLAPTLYFNDPNRHLLEIRTYER